MKKPIFIAEVKTQSPFGFKSKFSFKQLLDTAIKYGDWISIHTNPLWGGSYEQIEFARRLTDKPILAKGIHSRNEDINRALSYGANYVLVVDRNPFSASHFKECLFEISYDKVNKLFRYPAALDLKVVVNSRNLATGVLENNEDLNKYTSDSNFKWVCQASGIITPHYVNKNADAFIVGEHLMTFCKYI